MTPTPALAALLRLEVGRFRAAEHRRRFNPTVHVGSMAGDRVSLPLGLRELASFDGHLRTELLLVLLGAAPERSDAVWLTRPGVTVLHDEDVGWSTAARAAFGAVGRPLHGCYAITREGWLDVWGGDRRVWRRLRLR